MFSDNYYGDNMKENTITRDYILKIDYLCIHLINMGHPESAMIIYNNSVPELDSSNPDKKYAHFLLKEMLLCKTVST